MFSSFGAALGILGAGIIIGLLVMWGIKGFFKSTSVINSSSLLTAVKKVNEMVTLRTYFQDVIDKKVITNLLIMNSESRCLLTYYGEIVCHFDMSKTEVEVLEGDKRVIIKMPSCDLEPIVDVSGVKEYDTTRGVYDLLTFQNRFNYNEMNNIVTEAKAEIVKKANNEWKLKDKAKENARIILENFVRPFGYSAEVSFTEN